MDSIDKEAREKWQEREANGIGSVLMDMQHIGDKEMDASFIDTRIEYLSNFDMNEEGTIQEMRWCSGIVEDVSDGTWIKAGTRQQRYKEGEAARVLWDAVPEANFAASKSVEVFDKRLWNQNSIGAWRKDLGEVDYGLY